MANTVFDDILGELRMGDTASGGSGGASLVGGYRTSIAGGTASFVPSADIVTVTGASVTLQPDTAYKIYATTSAVTLNANVPAAGKWAYDGHIELFVAGTGYVQTGANVVLANALEPDSVNNCTVRFHDGLAIISVEDHIAGYVVVSATGTTAGTLPYALTSATQEYVAFDASLNGATIDLSGSTASAEKHIVGNGYTETTLTGAVYCGTSKFTVANLALQDVVVNGGTMTLGDAYIPSGSTVAVSGGGLAVEKVSGNGGVIDLGATHVFVPNGEKSYASGCTFTSGASDSGGALYVSGGTATFENVTFSGNSATSGGAVYNIVGKTTFSSCTFSGNTAAYCGAYVARYAGVTMSECIVTGNSATDFPPGVSCSGGVFVSTTISGNVTEKSSKGKDLVLAGGTSYITDCTLGDVSLQGGAVAVIAGQNNTIDYFRAFYVGSVYRGGIIISSGASIQLTHLMEPGDGITVLAGGATVNGNFIGSVESDTVYTSIDSNGSGTLAN